MSFDTRTAAVGLAVVAADASDACEDSPLPNTSCAQNGDVWALSFTAVRGQVYYIIVDGPAPTDFALPAIICDAPTVSSS